MPKRYGSRGTIITTDRNTHTSQTGSGSSSRRTSYGDVLSKRWENRMMSDPESSEAHNIDAIRKHNVLQKLGITNQGRMNRLKTALTHGSEPRNASWAEAPTLDQKRWDSYNLGTEIKYKTEIVPKQKKEK
jgi:hypothetical protein